MPRVVRFGEFVFDADGGLLTRDGEDRVLPPRAAEVLGALIERAGEVVPKDDLLAAAWPDSFVSEDSLTHAISLIRTALEDDARQPRFVQTVPRRGYRFVAAVEPGPQEPAPQEPAPELVVDVEASPTAPPAQASEPERASLRRGLLVPLAAIVAVVGLAAAGAYWLGGEVSGDSEDVGLVVRRIAIPEFAFSDPELIPVAERLRRAVEARLERTAKWTATAAEDSDAILLGSVERAGDALAIDVRIRGTDAETNWWRQRWVIPEQLIDPELFARSFVSRAYFLIDAVSAYSVLRRSPSEEATLMFLLATELMLGPAQEDFFVSFEAASTLEDVLVLDPGFARARAGRIAILAETVYWRPWTPEQTAVAAADLERAERDDPRDPIVHAARALYALLNEDYETMQAAIGRAVELGPDLFWVHMIRADLERRQGVYEAALASARRSVDLDPYLPAALDKVVDVHLESGDLEAAGAWIDRLQELAPGSFWSERATARLLRLQGRYDDAATRLEALRAEFGDTPWVYRLLHDFYREAGRDAEADRAGEIYRTLSR